MILQHKHFICTLPLTAGKHIPENSPPQTVTHIGGFLVVVDLVDSSGQAEVSDLHHVVLRHQHVPGRHVSVDALTRQTDRERVRIQ